MNHVKDLKKALENYVNYEVEDSLDYPINRNDTDGIVSTITDDIELRINQYITYEEELTK